jgi:hypothetical protein
LRLAASFVLSACCWGQLSGIPTVSFDPQGPQTVKDATGRNIRGFQLIGVVVTSPQPLTCYGADVAAAATAARFSVKLDNVTTLNLTKAAAWSPWSVAAVVFPVVTGTIAVAADSSLLNLSARAKPRVQAAFTVMSTASALTLPLIKGAAPNPSSTISSVLLFKSQYMTPFSGVIGAGFPSPGAVEVPIHCSASSQATN